jgi:hypothetical protein
MSKPSRETGGSGQVVFLPVGTALTSTGLTFSLGPVNPLRVPLRLRCTSCRWQATVTGPDQIRDQADRHALAHEVDPRPSTAHLPARLARRKENA